MEEGAVSEAEPVTAGAKAAVEARVAGEGAGAVGWAENWVRVAHSGAVQARETAEGWALEVAPQVKVEEPLATEASRGDTVATLVAVVVPVVEAALAAEAGPSANDWG